MRIECGACGNKIEISEDQWAHTIHIHFYGSSIVFVPVKCPSCGEVTEVEEWIT